MDDLTLRYFESEMRYLREAGKEFAQSHPDRAALLNLDRVGDRDTYVERLFEGFAFLTGHPAFDRHPTIVNLLRQGTLRSTRYVDASALLNDAQWQKITTECHANC